MKKCIFTALILAGLATVILAKPVKLINVDYLIPDGSPAATVEQLILDFDSDSYQFKYALIDSGGVELIISPVDSKADFISFQRGIKMPESERIESVIQEEVDNNLVITISLAKPYVFKVSKLGTKLRINIHPELYKDLEGEDADGPDRFDVKYKSWEDKITDAGDFFYRGFLLLTLNYATIEGNTLSYSNGVFEFDEGFSSKQKVSFMGEGRVFGDYYLSAQAFYDPLDDSGFDYKPIRDFYFFAKLEKELNYISIGDHDKESFTNLYLNRFTQSFIGVEAHLETRPVAVTAIGAISKGGVQVQEFKGDNTTGPFQLSRTPIVAGSEFITIEERDKNSPTRVINTTAQTRGVDYFVNYEEGEVTFVTPVAQETFDRNPVYIVIRYQYERLGADKEYVTAAQIETRPFEFLGVGASYINKFTDAGMEVRDEVYGLNANLTLGDSAQVFAEYAHSKPVGKEGESGDAYYLTMQGKISDTLIYRGSYQKIDAGFQNIANTRLEFYNDQTRMDGEILYNMNENNAFTVGYRAEDVNVSHSEGNPTISNSTVYGQWQVDYDFLPLITLRYDSTTRADDNPEESKTVDSSLNEFTVTMERYIEFLGQTGLLGMYRYTENEDLVTADNGYTMDLYGLRLTNKPANSMMFFTEYRREHKESVKADGDNYDYDIIGLGARLIPFSSFSVDIKYEDRFKENLVLDVRQTEENIISIGSSYVISSELRLMGRYEERELSDLVGDTGQFSRTANVRFFAHPLKNFRIGLGYELEDRQYTDSDNRSYEDRLLVDASYKIKEKIEFYGRYQLDLNKEEFSPLPVTEAKNNIHLLGLRYWLSKRFDFLGRYKKQEITGVDDNTLTTFTFELGYKLHEKYKMILGYESAEFDHPTELSDNYEADNWYLRLAAIF